MGLNVVTAGAMVPNAYGNSLDQGGPCAAVLSYNATAGEVSSIVPLNTANASFSGLMFASVLSISGVQASEVGVITNTTASSSTGVIATGANNTITFTRTLTSNSECQILIFAQKVQQPSANTQ